MWSAHFNLEINLCQRNNPWRDYRLANAIYDSSFLTFRGFIKMNMSCRETQLCPKANLMFSNYLDDLQCHWLVAHKLDKG